MGEDESVMGGVGVWDNKSAIRLGLFGKKREKGEGK